MIQNTPNLENNGHLEEKERSHKIQSLRDMIGSAEKTIQSAKAMLLQLEGKKKLGRKRKVEDEDGTVVEGTFDGQVMQGSDGKQYPVPANYASKSKLVEGDVLKLTITPDSAFIYKQIGPAERKHAIGIVSQDESGNYYVIADGKAYRVLLASVTYFKVEPGDEVAIVLPRHIEAAWAAIENILQKGRENQWMAPKVPLVNSEPTAKTKKIKPAKSQDDEKENDDTEETQSGSGTNKQEILDEWVKDLEDIEKEMKQPNSD